MVRTYCESRALISSHCHRRLNADKQQQQGPEGIYDDFVPEKRTGFGSHLLRGVRQPHRIATGPPNAASPSLRGSNANMRSGRDFIRGTPIHSQSGTITERVLGY